MFIESFFILIHYIFLYYKIKIKRVKSIKLKIYIKIKNIYRSYRLYRLTDKKILTNRLPTDKVIGINFLTDYRSVNYR
jgi:hypothetical protein